MLYIKFVDVFQFHKGTIRTLEAVKQYPTSSYFNSIKVRLEQDVMDEFRQPPSSFQFHKGTIRTFLI